MTIKCKWAVKNDEKLCHYVTYPESSRTTRSNEKNVLQTIPAPMYANTIDRVNQYVQKRMNIQ